MVVCVIYGMLVYLTALLRLTWWAHGRIRRVKGYFTAFYTPSDGTYMVAYAKQGIELFRTPPVGWTDRQEWLYVLYALG